MPCLFNAHLAIGPSGSSLLPPTLLACGRGARKSTKQDQFPENQGGEDEIFKRIFSVPVAPGTRQYTAPRSHKSVFWKQAEICKALTTQPHSVFRGAVCLFFSMRTPWRVRQPPLPKAHEWLSLTAALVPWQRSHPPPLTQGRQLMLRCGRLQANLGQFEARSSSIYSRSLK